MDIQNIHRLADKAAEHISAQRLGLMDGIPLYYYFAEETKSYYLASRAEMALLGEDLEFDTPNTYSKWCSSYGLELDLEVLCTLLRDGLSFDDDLPTFGGDSVTSKELDEDEIILGEPFSWDNENVLIQVSTFEDWRIVPRPA